MAWFSPIVVRRVRLISLPVEIQDEGLVAERIAEVLRELDCTSVTRSGSLVAFEAAALRVSWNPTGATTSGSVEVEMNRRAAILTFVLQFGQVLPIFAFLGPMGLFLALILAGPGGLVPFCISMLGLSFVWALSILSSASTLPSHVCWQLSLSPFSQIGVGKEL